MKNLKSSFRPLQDESMEAQARLKRCGARMLIACRGNFENTFRNWHSMAMRQTIVESCKCTNDFFRSLNEIVASNAAELFDSQSLALM